MTTKNLHKVPLRSWRKWDATERRLFNQLWSRLAGPRLGALSVSVLDAVPRLADRRVLRFNICWLAAQSLRDLRKDAR